MMLCDAMLCCVARLPAHHILRHAEQRARSQPRRIHRAWRARGMGTLRGRGRGQSTRAAVPSLVCGRVTVVEVQRLVRAAEGRKRARLHGGWRRRRWWRGGRGCSLLHNMGTTSSYLIWARLGGHCELDAVPVRSLVHEAYLCVGV